MVCGHQGGQVALFGLLQFLSTVMPQPLLSCFNFDPYFSHTSKSGLNFKHNVRSRAHRSRSLFGDNALNFTVAGFVEVPSDHSYAPLLFFQTNPRLVCPPSDQKSAL